MDDVDPAYDPETGGLSGVVVDMYTPSESGSTTGHTVLSSGMTAEDLREMIQSEVAILGEAKKKRKQQAEAYPRPAFGAFRAAFPQGPIVVGDELTIVEVDQWSNNFISALDADTAAATEAAMRKVRPRLDPIENEIAKIVAQKRKAHEEAEEDLKGVLADFDKQSKAARRLATEDGAAEGEDSDTDIRRKETETIWRQNKGSEIDSRFAPEYNPLVVAREKLLKEVEADLKRWMAQTERYRQTHAKWRKEYETKMEDAYRVRKAAGVRDAVIRTVSDRAGTGVAADVAVLASSVTMGAMVKISQRQTFYAVLRRIVFGLLVIALLVSGYYMWKTRTIHALLKRGQTFRRPTTTVNEIELLSEPPQPAIDYDHFFWLRNTTGVCTSVSDDDFAKNRVTIPWSDGTNVTVTLSAVAKWLSTYAGKSTCFCAQHIGLSLRAMRLHKDGEPYVLFNPKPVRPDMTPGRYNLKTLEDDALVQFSDTVRAQWVVEDDGPLPDWAQNPAFRFPKRGFFDSFDWKKKEQKVYLDDGGAACYGYCELLCK
jgi:t-SNARE complex subunit (syntaxin)